MFLRLMKEEMIFHCWLTSFLEDICNDYGIAKKMIDDDAIEIIAGI